MVAPEREDVAAVPTSIAMCTPQPVPWGGVLARLRASVGLRRFVPTGTALVATDLVHRTLLRLRPSRFAEACAVMEAVVGGTPLEADIPRLARRHAASVARQWELTWRPWELDAVPVHGVAHLRAVQATGRGVLVSFMHYGPFVGLVPLTRLADLYGLNGDWLLEKPRPGYQGYQVEQRRRVLCAHFKMLRAEGSAGALLRVLRGGGAVVLAMDLPGRTPTRFLGKTVELTNGTARLAMATDALVVPVAMVPRGRRFDLAIQEPVDPRDHPCADDLHQHLAGIHERIIMQAPEHLESPLRPGSWATPTPPPTPTADRGGRHAR